MKISNRKYLEKMPQVDPKEKQKVAFVGKHDRSWVQA